MKKLLLLCAFSGSLALRAQTMPAGVQFVNNSGDAALSTIKVWLNDTVWTAALQYRYVNALAILSPGINTVAVTQLSATSASQALTTQTFNVASGSDRIHLILNGISSASSSSYSPAQPLTVSVVDASMLGGPQPNKSTVLLTSGSTDCVSLTISSGTESIANSLSYGSTTIAITAAGNRTFAVYSGGTLIRNYAWTMNWGFDRILASGFATPSSNNGGLSLQLFYVPYVAGPLQMLLSLGIPGPTGLASQSVSALQVWPAISDSRIYIAGDSGSITVIDLSGRTVYASAIETMHTIHVGDWPAGIYQVIYSSANKTDVGEARFVKTD